MNTRNTGPLLEYSREARKGSHLHPLSAVLMRLLAVYAVLMLPNGDTFPKVIRVDGAVTQSDDLGCLVYW